MRIGSQGDELVTHALGSCLGLVVYDPVVAVGGLLHAMLPMSRINPAKTESNPCMFVDTGVPALFQSVYEAGGQKPRLIVKAVGCGNPIASNEMFNIGERNYSILKKLLEKNKIFLEAEDVGGRCSRTVLFKLGTGEIWVTSNGAKRRL
jgi:chemotaxis protein CheD